MLFAFALSSLNIMLNQGAQGKKEMSQSERQGLLRDTADRAARYLETLDKRAVAADPDSVKTLRDNLETDLPLTGQQDDHIIDFLDTYGGPATVASAAGRYFGFVTGGPCRLPSRPTGWPTAGIRTDFRLSVPRPWQLSKTRLCAG